MNKKSIIIMGGLGNQMFQSALYLANKDKCEGLYVDKSWFGRNHSHNGYELENIFNLKKELKEISLQESYFNYKKDIISKILFKIKHKIGFSKVTNDKFIYKKNLLTKTSSSYYIGYWQSEKYFSDSKELIKKVFTFPEILDEKNSNLLNLINDRESVSIHIRRGDYIGHPELDGLAPLDYYEKSIDYIKERVENPIFLIFSNDIEWCRENFKNIKNDFVYIDWNTKENSFRDMQLMSLCKHNIIPNSSFSWWGAWLNQNPEKIVIAPEKWFNDISKIPYEDIIPKSWIKIKNY